MKQILLTLMVFLTFESGIYAQPGVETFDVGHFTLRATSATTAEVVRVETRRPDRPIPITYYYEEYEIPAKVTTREGKEYTVTSIGEEAFHITDAQDEFRVKVPATVRHIGARAFYFAPVTEIQFAGGMQSIGEEAFAHSSLHELNIAGSVKEMGKGICSFAPVLRKVTIGEGVTRLPDHFCESAERLEELHLANSVREIGKSAFRGCTSMAKMNWPTQLQKIGDIAFEGVPLSDGNLPSHLQSIGQFAFYNSGLKSVTLPATLTTLEDGVFHSVSLERIEVNASNRAFASHQGILMNKAKTAVVYCPLGLKGKVTLPGTMNEIGEFAFLHTMLEEVTIPSSVKTVRKGAFDECAQLTTLHLNNGLTTIEEDAFRKCLLLNHVVLPATLSQLSGTAFSFCDALTDLSIDPANKHFAFIDGDLYNAQRTLLMSVKKEREGIYHVRDGVTAIDDYAFSQCTKLTEIGLPGSVKHIGSGTFTDCEQLERVDLPEGLVSIGEWAFNGCKKLKYMVLPSTLKEIGSTAFHENESLTEMTFPAGLRVLPERLLDGCKSLRRIVLPEGMDEIGRYAFRHCEALTEVTVPTSVTRIGTGAFSNCTSLTRLTLPPHLRNIPVYMVYGCKQLRELSLPEHIDSIMDSGLAECGLTRLTIPKSVRHIGKYAFNKCEQLSDVTLQQGLDAIENGTFSHCKSMKAITLPSGLHRIGEYSFSHCESLEEIIIPEGVDSLGKRSFEFCYALRVIDLPSTLKEVGWDSFVRVDKPSKIIFRSPTPPTGGLGIPSTYLNRATIYLPAGSQKAYSSTRLLNDYYYLELKAKVIEE